MPGRFVFPLDPNCPEVVGFEHRLYGDPMTSHYGAPVDDIIRDFTRKHGKVCNRCKEYGLANVEAEYY